MTNIINPFKGCKVTATWAWHLAHKSLSPIPGTDYQVAPGEPVHAAASGRATHTIGAQHQVSIAVTGGAITIRELGAVKGVFPRTVKQGEIIGYASLPKWPHIEFDRITTAGTTYEPFEKHVTPTTALASTGTAVPVTNKGDTLMVIKFGKRSWLIDYLGATEITGHESEYTSLPHQTYKKQASLDDALAAAKARGAAYAGVIAAAVKA